MKQDQRPPHPHKCPEQGCGRIFNRKYTLVEHLKTHTGEKPHVCPVRTCNKRFSTSGNLARHKRLHGFIQPLECPVEGCECTFPSDNKLEKHMRFHRGGNVHVCTVGTCGKTFSTTGNLNRHVKQHHPTAKTELHRYQNYTGHEGIVHENRSFSSFDVTSQQSPSGCEDLPQSAILDERWTQAVISSAKQPNLLPPLSLQSSGSNLVAEAVQTMSLGNYMVESSDRININSSGSNRMSLRSSLQPAFEIASGSDLLDDMIDFHVSHIGV